jgi:hypothetical protein
LDRFLRTKYVSAVNACCFGTRNSEFFVSDALTPKGRELPENQRADMQVSRAAGRRRSFGQATPWALEVFSREHGQPQMQGSPTAFNAAATWLSMRFRRPG